MNENSSIKSLRKNYQTKMLEKKKVKKNPFDLFQDWFDEALQAEFIEPNAMSIATINNEGEISSRMILLKEFDARGFVFFTNYNSKKSQDIQNTNKAALNIWWDKLYRQVRISGQVVKVSRQESVEYFRTRPRGSQLGAHASRQSEVIENYSVLEKQYRELEQHYQNQEIPCPDHWGGFRVEPVEFEFWQGRPNRLHDRLRYTRLEDNDWKIERLSP